MAAAGNGSEAQLASLEAALTGARRVPAPVAEATSDDVVARVDAAADLCREAGRYAKDHGAYLDEISTAFADKLRAMTAEYARNMLAAEERRMAELRRILGKDRGMNTALEFLIGAALFATAYRGLAGHWPWQ